MKILGFLYLLFAVKAQPLNEGNVEGMLVNHGMPAQAGKLD